MLQFCLLLLSLRFRSTCTRLFYLLVNTGPKSTTAMSSAHHTVGPVPLAERAISRFSPSVTMMWSSSLWLMVSSRLAVIVKLTSYTGENRGGNGTKRARNPRPT